MPEGVRGCTRIKGREVDRRGARGSVGARDRGVVVSEMTAQANYFGVSRVSA